MSHFVDFAQNPESCKLKQEVYCILIILQYFFLQVFKTCTFSSHFLAQIWKELSFDYARELAFRKSVYNV